MNHNLPALHLLAIFEASARHESFKLASNELFITPSAVSHQIKALESFIGFPLFIRKSRGVSLNAAGKMYLGYVQESLSLVEQGTKMLKRKYSAPSLKITTFPSMASNVIIPQLSLFQEAHPEIEIRLETAMNIVDFRDEDFDIGLRVGKGNWPNVSARKLFDINVAAVCSEEFAKKHKLKYLDQINQVPLIDLALMDNVWQTWAKAADIKEETFNHNLTFGSYEASLNAAEQGLGLALALMPIENSLIERKILVNPFNQVFPYNQSLYAVYRHEEKDRHDINCFLNWLIKSPNLKPLR